MDQKTLQKIGEVISSLGLKEEDLLVFLEGKQSGKVIDSQIQVIDSEIEEHRRAIAELESSKEILKERKKIAQEYVNEKLDEAICASHTLPSQCSEQNVQFSGHPIDETKTPPILDIGAPIGIIDRCASVNEDEGQEEPVILAANTLNLLKAGNDTDVRAVESNEPQQSRALRSSRQLQDYLLSGARKFKNK